MKTVRGIWLHLLQLTILIFITTVVSAQLRADFSAKPITGCPPMVVSFKDSSTGNPTSYKWDLGNGTISFLKDPIATYFSAGNYNIKLVVTNASGKDSIVKSQYITVKALPVPDFSVSDSVGCFPLKVRFKDNSLAGSGNITSWQWDFGDGTLSTVQNPVHTYTSPGTFTVILRITNSNGCVANITKSSLINIKDGVKADFRYSSDDGCRTPTSINFTNLTAGTGALSYLWDFGDGQTSTQPNPTNIYSSGVYTVRLIATNSIGCADTIIKPNSINIGSVRADFSSPVSACAGTPLQLTNTSTPTTFTAAFWYFRRPNTGNTNDENGEPSNDPNSPGNDPMTSTEINPAPTFTKPGTYQIKMVADFGSCKDSVVKSITILPRPKVAFTSSNTTGCAPPLNVSFRDSSQNAVSYQWSFGDGTSSTLQNPVHAYTSLGAYSVSLTVKNTNGCTATTVKENLVRLSPLKIQSINNLGIKGCIPVTVVPNAIIADDLPIATYLWHFGDGTTSTDAKPSHTYTKPGTYNVKLVVTTAEGCKDSLIIQEAVKAGSKAATNFSADPRDVCASMPVNFKDLSTGAPIEEWLWFFGDGGTSGLQNPVYIYNDTGYFNVTLITSNFGCNDTLRMDKFIHVKPPIAKFDTAFSCNDPLTRNFIDRSIGANTYAWDFGDGTTSTVQNPSHTYSGPGNYQVNLTVTNGECQHTAKKDVVVIKEAGKFTFSENVSCLNTRIIFKVENINETNVLNYRWYFNGLNGSVMITENNPVALAFDTPGERPSVVVVTNILNCKDTLNAAVPLKTYGPKAAFGSIAPNTCFGNTINFLDSSTSDGIHPITEYVWNYGDSIAKSYTAGPFSHDYSRLGTFSVKLVVKDSYGCIDSITRPDFVSITKPIAKFTASDTALCPAVPVLFMNESTGVNVRYNWAFGDGTISDTVSPVHAYTQPGVYHVGMAMIDKNGCTDSTTATIKIYAAKAEFVMSDSFSTCPPLVVNINNQSSNYIDFNWDFGDGGSSQVIDPSHIYTYPGTYTVKLSVKNNGGCVDTLTKKVVIRGPTGTFDYYPKEACNPGKVNYMLTSQNNTVSYVWDFNDGNTIFSELPNVSHTYVNPGLYLPKIIMEDGSGCKVAVQGPDTVKVYSVNTNILSDTRILCDSGYISFRDSTISNDMVGSFLWNFGDGTTSTQRNPTHSFSDTGYYSIDLITTTRFGCKDSAVSRNYVKVVNSPSIKMLGDTSACEPAKIKLIAGFVRTDTSAVTWEWNFGNGAFSNKQIPDSQTYAQTGSYQVTVKATNSDGCSQTVTRTAIIHPKPDVDAGPDATICRYKSHTLTATGAASYTWTSHPSLTCTNCATPEARPDSLISYHVIGKSLFGCTNEDSVTIGVHQPFTMIVDKGDTLCVGESVALKATGADNYEWTPALWLNDPTSPSPKARPDSSITYTVTGSDRNGCFKDSQSVTIKVYPIPSINIINGDKVNLQTGSSIRLRTKSSQDVTSWSWFPSQGLSCSSCSETVAAPTDKVTYNVTATNEGNCTAADQVTINVFCNDANVFIPNTFSPNGDGANDVFYPRGSGLFDVSTFKVFNRWGQVVFQKNGVRANNPQDGWDGTLNGLPLQPDVYVYLIEVVCSSKNIFPFKGNVSLIR